jgi:ferredoxin
MPAEPARLRVTADRDICVGAGTCLRIASRIFDQDQDDGLVVLIDATPPPELHEAVREAADNCPSGAIWLDEG